jgi:hypothetical protein
VTFKAFAVNYLSPFYVMLRLAFLAMTGIGFLATISANGGGLGASELPQILLGIGLAFAATRLPLVWIFVLMFTALNPFISGMFGSGFVNWVVGLGAVFLWLWNALRPWQVGKNVHEINQKISEWQGR